MTTNVLVGPHYMRLLRLPFTWMTGCDGWAADEVAASGGGGGGPGSPAEVPVAAADEIAGASLAGCAAGYAFSG